MRRWRGQVQNWTLELRVISYDDDYRVDRILANSPDDVMESLANFIFRDNVVANSPNYVWISNNNDIGGLMERLRSSNSAGGNFLTSNHLSITSVFTFVTAGQVGHQPNFIR